MTWKLGLYRGYLCNSKGEGDLDGKPAEQTKKQVLSKISLNISKDALQIESRNSSRTGRATRFHVCSSPQSKQKQRILIGSNSTVLAL